MSYSDKLDKTGSRKLMNETFEYIERRLEPQRKWHNEKATWNKRRFYTVEVTTLLAGAAIPIVNVWVVKDPYWAGVLSSILGGIVVVAASIGKLFKFHENWNTGRWSKRLSGKRSCIQSALASTLKRTKRGVIDFSRNVSKTSLPTRLRNSSRLTKVQGT
jgi:exopolysaccharide biosynthesis predicted pyruvyltransferase EpsI